MTLVLVEKGIVLGGLPSKIEVIGAPGMEIFQPAMLVYWSVKGLVTHRIPIFTTATKKST